MPRASAQFARHHCHYMPYQECICPRLSAQGTRILSRLGSRPKIPEGSLCVGSLGTAVLQGPSLPTGKLLGGPLMVTQVTSTEDAAASRAWAHGCCRSPGGGRGDVQPDGPPGEGPGDWSQCTELEGLPEHRMAGQPVHPAANSLTCPARAQPAPRAWVRGKTRDPQNPAPGPGALPRLPVQTLPSLQKCAWASLDGRRCP